MKTFSYIMVTNVLDQPTSIAFEIEEDYKEFVQQLLQILGMYNFMLKEKQNIWSEGSAFVDLSTPNGTLTLGISNHKKISLFTNNNQKDLLKIDVILSKFSVFKKEKLQLAKSA